MYTTILLASFFSLLLHAVYVIVDIVCVCKYE